MARASGRAITQAPRICDGFLRGRSSERYATRFKYGPAMLLGSRTDRFRVSSRNSGRSVRLRVFVGLGGPHDNDYHKHREQAGTNGHCHARVSNGVILNQSFPFSGMHGFLPHCLVLFTY